MTVPACYEVARWVECAEPALDFTLHVQSGGSLRSTTPEGALDRAIRAHEWTTAMLDQCEPGACVQWLRVHEYVRGLRNGLEMAARLQAAQARRRRL